MRRIDQSHIGFDPRVAHDCRICGSPRDMTMNRNRKTRLAMALAFATLTACSASGGTASAQSTDRPGFGRSMDAPVGAPFILPEGITLETPISGYSPEDPWKCNDIYGDHAYGHGALVRLCPIFRNTTGAPITVTLPPGLIFISNSSQVQNGILTQRISFEVPAGERFFAPMFMYCANGPRRSTASKDEYMLGPVTQYTDFQELFRILEGRDISRDDAGEIQVIVNHLQRKPGLTAEDRARAMGL